LTQPERVIEEMPVILILKMDGVTEVVLPQVKNDLLVFHEISGNY
jgi:hypothetical protein